jgi:hypothetical protein
MNEVDHTTKEPASFFSFVLNFLVNVKFDEVSVMGRVFKCPTWFVCLLGWRR